MSEDAATPVAETLAGWLTTVRAADLPPGTVDVARKLFIDVAGLCLAARHEDYVAATLAAVADPPVRRSVREGGCTA